MQWTLHADFTKANHAPVAIVNGEADTALPLCIEVEAGETIHLDSSQSYDPDGDALTFTWFHYKEPTIAMGVWDLLIPNIEIVDIDEVPGRKVQITMPLVGQCAVDYKTGEPQRKGHTYHFILEVKDNGTPALVSYKRVIVQTTNKHLQGRRPPLPRVADWEPK
jgi:hypothetical protein